MSAEEIEKYINSIAFSGAEEFLEKYKGDESSQIIGHFGLGFYSAFMVAKRVTIDSKSYDGSGAAFWECDGGTEFAMEDGKRTSTGTLITLHMDPEHDELLQPARIRSILQKYCTFLPYPIYIDGEETAVNDEQPLWLKKPSEVTDEEYIAFYHKVFSDFNDPLFWLHLSVEYPFNLSGILYFPKLTHEFESAQGQIKLYNNRVFVADNIKEVIPEFLMLLKGVMDCPDLPLNVSRSFLQNDGYVTKIASYITRKVADKLSTLQQNERERFNECWESIAPFVEYGCISNDDFYDKVEKILQVKDIDGNYTTLADYAASHENNFVYVTDEKTQGGYVDMYRQQGKSAVIMPHLIDLHFITLLERKQSWTFTRIDADIDGSAEDEAFTDLFKDVVGERVTVRTASLDTPLPAIITQDEQMRRMSDQMRLFGGNAFPTNTTLVLNTNSTIVTGLQGLSGDKQKVVAQQIYDLARISHGSLPADAMAAFISRSADLLGDII